MSHCNYEGFDDFKPDPPKKDDSQLTPAKHKGKQHHKVLVCDVCGYEIDYVVCSCEIGTSHAIYEGSEICDNCEVV